MKIKIFENPKEAIRIVNIVFLILVLLFIGNTLYGLVTGTKSIDSLWIDGLFFLILLNSWILALRPFYDKLEKIRISKDDFELFEDVRTTGIVNMSIVKNVATMSGLSKEKVLEIMNNYEHYKDIFEKYNKKKW